jgi:flagellar assembly protein FliH
LSRLLHSPVLNDKVIVGEFRADIEADKIAEKTLTAKFTDLNIITSIEGRKLVSVQEIIKISERLDRAKESEKELEYKRGYDTGHQSGLKEGQADARKVIDNFASLIKDAIKQREILYEEARRKILELIIKISRKVTFDAAKIDPEITAGIISGTVNKLVDKSHMKVKVHPDHLSSIELQIDRFRGDSTVIKDMVIEPDSRVRYGGCFIETPSGDIDARVESQMEIVAEALSEVEGTS